jgi:hypothetical protein
VREELFSSKAEQLEKKNASGLQNGAYSSSGDRPILQIGRSTGGTPLASFRAF